MQPRQLEETRRTRRRQTLQGLSSSCSSCLFAVILHVCVPRGLSLGESDRRAGATKLRNESNFITPTPAPAGTTSMTCFGSSRTTSGIQLEGYPESYCIHRVPKTADQIVHCRRLDDRSVRKVYLLRVFVTSSPVQENVLVTRALSCTTQPIWPRLSRRQACCRSAARSASACR